MPLHLALPLFLLVAMAIVAGLYHAIVWWRIARAQRLLPTAADGLALGPPGGGWPSVCVIVPAHNEEDVIEEAARSLLAQEYDDLRIVFSLDRCTDETEQRLRAAVGDDPRVEVLVIEECPEDWSGKTHAMWSAYERSRGARDAQRLLFLDADASLDPRCIRAGVAMQDHRDVGLLSLLPTLTLDRWFERIVQPAAGFELVRQFPLDLVNDPSRPRRFANGQFMLFRREAYERFGGHAKVKRAVLEDMAIASVMPMAKHGSGTIGVLMAGGMMRCRMYRSWDRFRRGWKRIYTECANRRPRRLRQLAWRQRFTGLLPLWPPLAIVAGLALLGVDRPLASALLISGGGAIVATIGAFARIYRAQELPVRYAPLYPLGAWLVAGILGEAARDLREGRAIEWAGKSYVRKARA